MKNFKKVISAVVALALSASTFVSASSFTDVADTASYAEAIDVLSALGIVNGYAEEDGTYTFKPEGTITRAEAATMIVGALNMTADAQASAGTSKFADVNSQASWAAGYINVGVAQGFINGMDENTFAPQDNVTYAQMCVMLTSIAGYGEYAANNGGYPTGYTSMAATTGINKGVAVSNDTALTRGQVAQMIWNTLQTPMLGVYEYSFQGNTYTQLDGKNNRDFKTLLSDKFDGYVVTAEVLATAKSDTSVSNGEATIDVTKADCWDDEAVPCLAHGAHNETVLLNGVSLDDQLFQVGKAVLVIDDNDDVNLIYFAANSKTETKEFAAEDYVMQSKLGGSNKYGNVASVSTGSGKLRFGSKYITMNTSVSLYVNGKSYKTFTKASDGTNGLDNANALLDTFLGNAQGTIKLVKQDTDTGYSKIFVDYYDVAKVTSVDYKNGQTIVVMTPDTNAATPIRKITINDDSVEDGDVDVTVTKNGNEIELKDLQKDDIIAYAVEVTSTTPMTDPDHIKIIATSDTVSGKVTSENDDDEQYIIDGTAYDCVNYSTGYLTVGNSYELTLDPFGRIWDYEEDAVSTKYAIVEKWNDSAETVSLLLADGTSKSYELASNVTMQGVADTTSAVNTNTNPLKTFTDARNFIFGDGNTSGTKLDPQARVVEYTIKTSDNTIRTMTWVKATDLTGSEFKSNTNKLGSATINASTNVVDASDYVATVSAGLSDYNTFAADNFVNGTKYDAYGFKAGNASTYSFIILTKIGTKFNETSRFAVIKRVVGQETYNDEDAIRVDVFAGGAEASLYYYKGNSVTNGLKTGDAIYFELDSDGFVKNTYRVFEKATNTYKDFAAAGVNASDYEPGLSNSGTSDGWNFDLYDDGSAIQLVYGIVTEAKGSNVTLAPVTAGNIDTNDKVLSASATTGANTYGLASDAEIYVYDIGDTQSVYEYEKLYTGSVIASNFAMFETSKNSGIFTTTFNGENRADYTNYALAMIVDGDIVEIYTINK